MNLTFQCTVGANVFRVPTGFPDGLFGVLRARLRGPAPRGGERRGGPVHAGDVRPMPSPAPGGRA